MNLLNKLSLIAVAVFSGLVSHGADDISLTSAVINNLTFDYEKVHLSQAQGLTFTCYVDNIANFDHTGIFVNLKIVDSNDDTIYNNNSAPKTVLAGTNDSVVVTVPFDAPEAGKYTFLFEMFQDIPDAIPNNNTDQLFMFVDGYVYQRDDGNVYGTNSWLSPSSYYELGNYFEMQGPAIITATSVYIDPDTDIGTYVFSTLYEFNQGWFDPIAFAQDHEITADDLGDTINLFFPSGVSVSGANPLCLMIGNYGGMNLEIGMSQTAPDFSVFYVDEWMDWYFIQSTPMIRMRFDTYEWVEESEETMWSLYPNPSSTLCRVDLFDDQQHPMTIATVSGQVVNSTTVRAGDEIDVSELPSGVYFVTIDEVTKKLIVE